MLRVHALADRIVNRKVESDVVGPDVVDVDPLVTVESCQVRHEALEDESATVLQMVGDPAKTFDLPVLVEEPEKRVEHHINQ